MSIRKAKTYQKKQYKQKQAQHRASSRANKDKPTIKGQFTFCSIKQENYLQKKASRILP